MTQVLHLPGLSDYREVHALQKHLLAQRIAHAIPDTLLMLEHAPTITVGRARGAHSNVLAPAGTPVVEVERGGDVTWHGPGQLVVYPIVDLRNRREDLHAHLHALEEAVIRLLAQLGIHSQRDGRNTGVWLAREEGLPQKVCSIGIACRRWVTWHGLALNLDPDPTAFHQINPCGFGSDVMTRLADHLAPCPPLAALLQPLADHLADALEIPRANVQGP